MIDHDALALAERADRLVRSVLGLLTPEQIAEANDITSRVERLRRGVKEAALSKRS